MSRDRRIQLVATVILLISTVVCGAVLPRINDRAEDYALRYTDIAVEGAPPFVALGTMIGALRGVIVDYLWIKVNYMKEKGLFYEVMADAELITKLQPRFAPVWAFHGHNMAYNISVATHTQEERWEWVSEGIDLVRKEGIRYNPNDLVLYKELSFWFAHKIDGYSDDAHAHYKQELAREWHYLLGEPPVDQAERVAWIKRIADAPRTLAEAERRAPGVLALVERLGDEIGIATGQGGFDIENDFLLLYGEWNSMRNSPFAQLLGVIEDFRQTNPVVDVLEQLESEVGESEQWTTLIDHLRRARLEQHYNMSPQLMYEYTEQLGPIDWRHAQAHALYWSRTGSEIGERRQANDDDVYKILNNDRLQLQAMQGLARYGRITFDPLNRGIPTRMPDSRWIDAIVEEFKRVYVKHYGTRGGGGDSFAGFMENFLSSALREMYRMGFTSRAKELMSILDEYFGRGAKPANNKYAIDLEIFVWELTKNELAIQPHLAQSELMAALHNGMVNGIIYDQPKLMAEARHFAMQVVNFYKTDENNYFRNKFGDARMGQLVSDLETMEASVLTAIMIERTYTPEQRMTLWRQLDEFYPGLRAWTYDNIKPQLEAELAATPWGLKYTIDEVLPAPPNIEQVRQAIAADRDGARRMLAEEISRATISRQQ